MDKIKEEQLQLIIEKYNSNKIKSEEITEYIPLLLLGISTTQFLHNQNEIVKMIVSTIGEYSKKQTIQNIYSIIPEMMLFLNKYMISHLHHSSFTGQLQKQSQSVNSLNNTNNINTNYCNINDIYTISNPFIPGTNIPVYNIVYFTCGISKIMTLLLKNERLYSQPFVELIMTLMKVDSSHMRVVYETIVFVIDSIGKKLKFTRSDFSHW